MPFYEVGTLKQDVDRSLWLERMLVALGTVFGVFSTTLAAIGLYGMLAYFVSARQREIGLRLALGARPGHIGWLVSTHLIPAVAIGLAAGGALAYLAGAWVRGLLYEGSRFDVHAAGAAAALVVAVAVTAAAWPLLRALRVDPASTLRAE